MIEQLSNSWQIALADEFTRPYFGKLQQFVDEERRQHQVFPPEEDVFSAFRLTALEDVRVLILGQDPYHDNGQAHGLQFFRPEKHQGASVPAKHIQGARK